MSEQMNEFSAESEPVSKPEVKAVKKRRAVPEIIMEVVSMGVAAHFDEGHGGWVIPGFYRAKGIVIRYEEGNSTGQAVPLSNKRLQPQPIKNFDDLVELNYAWWNISRKESLDYELPEEGWKEEFNDRDLVERRLVFLPKAKTFNPMREQN